MKTLITTILLSLTTTSAFASVSHNDDGMLLAYLFLGMCGLIILLQMLPVFALGFVIVKSLFKGSHHIN